MKRFYVGGRGHGKAAAMERLVKAGAYYDEIAVGIDPGEVRSVVVAGRKGGSIYVLDELDDSHAAYEMIQRQITEHIVALRERHEAFLRQIFRITDEEAEGVRRLDPIIVERLVARMNDDNHLPTNFWESVAAHNMLEDEVGRRLVADIIAKKVGCNGERTSD